MDALRRPIAKGLEPLTNLIASKSLTVKSLATAIFQLLENFQCRQKIVTWMDQATALGNLEESAEHERVWDELTKLFDEMVNLFGDEPITLPDFSAILDSALENFDLALTPPTVDQVLVGSVDRTRTPPAKACAVLGLAEGQFPRATRENSIFTDSDRRALAAENIDLDPDTSRHLLDENFLAYIAFTRPSDHLLLTRATTDDENKPIAPSPFWLRVQTVLPEVKVIPPATPSASLRQISTPRQLVASLMNWVRDGATDPQWQAPYQWLAARPPADDALSIARSCAWKALSYRNEARLDPAQRRRPLPLAAERDGLSTRILPPMPLPTFRQVRARPASA